MTASQIRQAFLNFFANKGHEIVHSAPLVIKDDPTLMFVNAGMNPFKDIFTGAKPAKHSRVADSQKCLRVSGKHNDLEEVGIDTYHHTLFEMLGNWSFGDYFKQEAIDWAWELLIDVYQLDPERLYVTFFEGDKGDGLAMDDEAKSHWAKHLPADRILNGNKADNFWEMGETGPCGPCSEIHIDLRPDKERKQIDGATLVNMDHPQVIEVWNLVFMQYQRLADGSLVDLPSQHVDTGMGFERLVRAIEGKSSNYDTDVFAPYIQRLESMSDRSYGKDESVDVAMRVIADHVRAVGFAIADGQLPSNTGAGYVIRRILRRAVRYGYSVLQFNEPFIARLVPDMVESMGKAFPELKAQQTLMTQVIEEEEQAFLRTLASGLKRLDAAMKQGKPLTGKQSFELYDTYGFPLDLTALICKEKGIVLDEKGFHEAMAEQKGRSKEAGAQKVGDWVEVAQGIGDQFVGYDQYTTESKLLRHRKVSNAKGDFTQVVIQPTPFYPEGGGQVGDRGWLTMGKDRIEVLNCSSEAGAILHLVATMPAKPSAEVEAAINEGKRKASAQNHSATHLLHKALRDILGVHVEQRGSFVSDEYLRFDFSHFQRIAAKELTAIESHVSAAILQDHPLQEFRESTMEEAKAKGAMALFGEKYGDSVRVIQLGDSVELCGGTHVSTTAALSPFVIVSESSVAAGIRRIEALAGHSASIYLKQAQQSQQAILALTKGQDPLQAMESMKKELSTMQKALKSYQSAQAGDLKAELLQSAKAIGPYNMMAAAVDLDAGSAKDLAFALVKQDPKSVVLLALSNDGKAQAHMAVGKQALDVAHAGQWVKALGHHIQGSGGGQDFYASAGGKSPAGIPDLLQAFEEKLTSCINA